MRTLHFGLRVADEARSLAFYEALGYQVVGTVPETEFGRLTMLQLPGDPFVAIELLHDPAVAAPPGTGLNHFVVQVDSMADFVARLCDRGVAVEEPSSPDRAGPVAARSPRGHGPDLLGRPGRPGRRG
jgi:lactoylglutathione lyase